jgi:hypothetical protein
MGLNRIRLAATLTLATLILTLSACGTTAAQPPPEIPRYRVMLSVEGDGILEYSSVNGVSTPSGGVLTLLGGDVVSMQIRAFAFAPALCVIWAGLDDFPVGRVASNHAEPGGSAICVWDAPRDPVRDLTSPPAAP